MAQTDFGEIFSYNDVAHDMACSVPTVAAVGRTVFVEALSTLATALVGGYVHEPPLQRGMDTEQKRSST